MTLISASINGSTMLKLVFDATDHSEGDSGVTCGEEGDTGILKR